jgi:hypothetical protein
MLLPKKRKQQLKEELAENYYEFLHWYNKLTNIAITRYKWKNLPDTINERALELYLYRLGVAVWFEDPDIGQLALRVALGGDFDVYSIPDKRTAYGPSHYTKQLNSSNSVLIWNECTRTNTEDDVMLYAKRLAKINRTIDVNVDVQNTPYVITSTEDNVLTAKNLVAKVMNNESIVFISSTLSPDTIKVLDLNAPFVADKLFELKTNIWNEALTHLGVPNLAVNKKERLITDEVNRTQGGTIASRHSGLLTRQMACDEINKMFPDNPKGPVSVEYNTFDYEELSMDGGSEDGTLHNTSKNDM